MVDEAAAAVRRKVEVRIDAYNTAAAELESMMRVHMPITWLANWSPTIGHAPDGGLIEQSWRERLTQRARIVETTGAHALEALRRELNGRAPARARTRGKPGSGGRDAAIWLTIADHHNGARGRGIFISGDSAFFGDDGQLADELRPRYAQNSSLTVRSPACRRARRVYPGGRDCQCASRCQRRAPGGRNPKVTPEHGKLWDRRLDGASVHVVMLEPRGVQDAHEYDDGIQLVDSTWRAVVKVLPGPDESDKVFAASISAFIRAQLYIADAEMVVIGCDVNPLSRFLHHQEYGWILVEASGL